MTKKNTFAIFVPSCDNYSDLWDILAQGYEKFWPDCTFKKYIITNSDIDVPHGFIAINVGPDTDWSSNCISALAQIPEDNVIMNIDDLILSHTVDNAELQKQLHVFGEKNCNYLKLVSIGQGSSQSSITKIESDAPYRTSTIFSVWKKEVLIDILQAGESPWEFEVIGTPRSERYSDWYYSSKTLIKYQNLVIKGVVERGALRRLKSVGLHYEGNRKVMSLGKNTKHQLECFIYSFILLLPSGISKKLIEGIRNMKK